MPLQLLSGNICRKTVSSLSCFLFFFPFLSIRTPRKKNLKKFWPRGIPALSQSVFSIYTLFYELKGSPAICRPIRHRGLYPGGICDIPAVASWCFAGGIECDSR